MSTNPIDGVTPLNREQRRAVEGFKPDRKKYRLRFEGTDYDGFVVLMRSVSFGVFLEMSTLTGWNPKKMGPDEVAELRRLFGTLASAIIEWNLLDDDDQPVPITVDGLFAQDPEMVIAVVNAWTGAMSDVSGPLGQRSSDGRPSPVASLPMEEWSPSQPS